MIIFKIIFCRIREIVSFDRIWYIYLSIWWTESVFEIDSVFALAHFPTNHLTILFQGVPTVRVGTERHRRGRGVWHQGDLPARTRIVGFQNEQVPITYATSISHQLQASPAGDPLYFFLKLKCFRIPYLSFQVFLLTNKFVNCLLLKGYCCILFKVQKWTLSKILSLLMKVLST